MNKYLLSIDPSINNTGYTLWNTQSITPILIGSYNFKKFNAVKYYQDFINNIKDNIKDNINGIEYQYKDLDIIIEKGFCNSKVGRGKSTLDYLRGFLIGNFNRLIDKEMLIYINSWRSFYKKNYSKYCLGLKWDKFTSIKLVEYLIKQNKWNIKINNHDEAESLLIGYYWLERKK